MSFKNRILSDKKDFERLFEEGRSFSNGGLRILLYPCGQQTKYAFCVSRRNGNAVKRNRLKRIVRHIILEISGEVEEGFLIALFPGRSFEALKSAERIRLARRLLQRGGVIKNNSL